MGGAECVWKTPRGWIGRCFHLGTNKEAYDAEVHAVCQALSTADQRSAPYLWILPQPLRGLDRTALGWASGFPWPLSRSPPGFGRETTRFSALGSVPPWRPWQRGSGRARRGRGRGQQSRRCSTGRLPIGDQSVSYGKGGRRDLVLDSCPVDRGPHWRSSTKISNSPWKGTQTQAPPKGARVSGRALLPAAVRARRHRPIFEGQDWQDGQRPGKGAGRVPPDV